MRRDACEDHTFQPGTTAAGSGTPVLTEARQAWQSNLLRAGGDRRSLRRASRAERRLAQSDLAAGDDEEHGKRACSGLGGTLPYQDLEAGNGFGGLLDREVLAGQGVEVGGEHPMIGARLP